MIIMVKIQPAQTYNRIIRKNRPGAGNTEAAHIDLLVQIRDLTQYIRNKYIVSNYLAPVQVLFLYPF